MIYMDMTAYDDEEASVTLEHVTVLQERMADILEDAYPDQGVSQIITNHFDTNALREQFLDMFEPPAFHALFQTEMGKGVIMGAFIQKHIFEAEV